MALNPYFFYFLTAVIGAGFVLILIWRKYLKHARIDKSKFDDKAMEDLKQYVYALRAVFLCIDFPKAAQTKNNSMRGRGILRPWREV